MPERMNEMNDLATMSATVTSMTLKEITDMLDVRHNNAMRTVESLAKDPAFGLVTKIECPIISGKGKTEYIKTYQLDKRQSISVAAHLNVALLMRIIDRWQELETKQAVIGNDHYAAKLINLGLLPGIVDWWEELVDRGYLYDESPYFRMTDNKPSLSQLRLSFRVWYSNKFSTGWGYIWSDDEFRMSLLRLSGMFSAPSVCEALKRGDKMYLLHKLPELKSKVKQVPLLGR
jgi:phage regulator Rha-like protein